MNLQFIALLAIKPVTHLLGYLFPFKVFVLFAFPKFRMCPNHHIILCGDLLFYSDAFVSHMAAEGRS